MYVHKFRWKALKHWACMFHMDGSWGNALKWFGVEVNKSTVMFMKWWNCYISGIYWCDWMWRCNIIYHPGRLIEVKWTQFPQSLFKSAQQHCIMRCFVKAHIHINVYIYFCSVHFACLPVVGEILSQHYSNTHCQKINSWNIATFILLICFSLIFLRAIIRSFSARMKSSKYLEYSRVFYWKVLKILFRNQSLWILMVRFLPSL